MLKQNILANLFGNVITAVISIICIPIYVKYIGVEAYGLIGVFASLQVIFSVLDMGLSATLNREFARLSVNTDGVEEQKNLLRTFEYIYVVLALLIGLIVALAAPFISKHWLSGNEIPAETVKFALIQMGVLLALRWPMALYAGGLVGLQKQVLYNFINTISEVVKALGAIAVLSLVRSSITTFFYWQIIITAVTVVALHFILWGALPKSSLRPFFNRLLIIKNQAFATGIGITSLSVIILTQADKIILSKILDLKTFAYFTLASAISSSLYKIIIPVSQAVYPRLVQLVHSDKENGLSRTFHMACQIISVIVLPVTFLVFFFAKELVLLWTHNADITEQVFPLVQVLIIGTACNAMVTIPYMTQLAFGWTKLGLYQNIIGIIILIPSIIYLTNLYGAMGAAWVWAILNSFYIVFSMPVMFRKILKKEMVKWYKDDIVILAIIALTSMGLLKFLFNQFHLSGNIAVVLYCAFAFFLVLTLTSFSAEHPRDFILKRVKRIF